MKRKLYILLAIILSVIDLFILSTILAGSVTEGLNGIVIILLLLFLLILAAAIRCVLSAIRDKGTEENQGNRTPQPPIYCEFCGRELGTHLSCPNCGANRPTQNV